MPIRETVTLQDALDAVEALPEYQQDDLISIIRQRRIERSREILADNMNEARAEYSRGDIQHGSADDLMKEIPE